MIAKVAKVVKIMTDFARITGLDPVTTCPKRYLWTDAFAVCNFLELHQQTKGPQYLDLAKRLVDQVHNELGKHRRDDPNGRVGWISGFGEEEGKLHPTIGGLRIGKEFNERQRHEPVDRELEWVQDGQYFHYLTKWMHALQRMYQFTGETHYLLWAIEMAKGVLLKFTHKSGHTLSGVGGHTSIKHRMYWKMSIDLSYPLVTSMGQHDALDGFITFRELQLSAVKAIAKGDLPVNLHLHSEIDMLHDMAEEGSWLTSDTLGLGGLLCDAYKVMQFPGLTMEGNDESTTTTSDRFHENNDLLIKQLLTAATRGIHHAMIETPSFLDLSVRNRLAFRELGFAIGLKAVLELRQCIQQHPDDSTVRHEISRMLRTMDEKYCHRAQEIEDFWVKISKQPPSAAISTWTDHQEINMIMLATSILPNSFLSISAP